MTSWHDILDNATGAAGNTGPVSGLTAIKKLQWASKARHLLQKESRAVRRMCEFQTDEFDDGYMDIADDIWTIERMTYTASAASKGSKIKLISFDELEKIREENSHSGVYLAQDFRRFHIYPLTGLDGVIRLDYVPKLTPYSPSQALVGGDWSGCTGDSIGAWIKQHYLEEEFETEVEGIEAYVAKRIYDTVPSGRTMFWREMRELDRVWEEALANVSVSQPSHTINNEPKAYSGPV